MIKAAFFDRDGVINYDYQYVYTPQQLIFRRGIFNFLRFVEDSGFKIFIITNQSGISKGFYTEEQFLDLTTWIYQQFYAKGIHITKTYYAPYDPKHVLANKKYDEYDRKPNPGMIIKAEKEFNIDLSKSFLMGDKKSDIQAGISAGIPLNMLLGKKCYQIEKDEWIVSSFVQAKKIVKNYFSEKGENL